MSFRFAQPQPRRRPSLTPMIDVVFLLLVFFMLAARFGQEGAFDLAIGGAATEWQGPPRLVRIAGDSVQLNGQAVTPEALIQALTRLTETVSDPIVIRADEGVALQRLLDVMAGLEQGGFTNLVLVAP